MSVASVHFALARANPAGRDKAHRCSLTGCQAKRCNAGPGGQIRAPLGVESALNALTCYATRSCRACGDGSDRTVLRSRRMGEMN